MIILLPLCNYIKTNFLGYNEEIKGNIEYNKIYLLNIIILSKCLDIISARCSGTVGIFIFSNGFRNSKIYDLGEYWDIFESNKNKIISPNFWNYYN